MLFILVNLWLISANWLYYWLILTNQLVVLQTTINIKNNHMYLKSIG